jgi:hypothetical protein
MAEAASEDARNSRRFMPHSFYGNQNRETFGKFSYAWGPDPALLATLPL